MISTTPHCGGPVGYDGEDLCADCDVQEIAARLSECGVEELKKLRRRVEDRLRKSPSELILIAARMAAAGSIRVDDLL